MFFVYNFHYKQQNCMKFQLEVYQDMLRHKQQKFHTFDSQYLLKPCARDEFKSVTYVVRNMASDTFDQKFGNRNKKPTVKMLRLKSLSGISLFSQGSLFSELWRQKPRGPLIKAHSVV